MKPVALVTGGQQGIGLGIAQALAGAGFSVAIAAERAPDDPVVRDALADLGPGARYFRHDVRDVEAVDALLSAVSVELGPVTTLVSNAGVPARKRGDMLELAPDDFDVVLDINLRGGFFLAQRVALKMIDDVVELIGVPYQSIVFVTSVSATMVSTERAEYCISKAGASMVAALFAARLAPWGIGVFEVRPGIIETAMTTGVKEKYTARIEAGLVPAGRWGGPADIGAAVLPLVRGDMAFATGAVIPVDGGLSIPRL